MGSDFHLAPGNRLNIETPAQPAKILRVKRCIPLFYRERDRDVDKNISFGGNLPADKVGARELHLSVWIKLLHDREIADDTRTDDRWLGRVAPNLIHSEFGYRKPEVAVEKVKRIPDQIGSCLYRFDENSLCSGLLEFAELFGNEFFIGRILVPRSDLDLGLDETGC
jgi:hypothetical protein